MKRGPSVLGAALEQLDRAHLRRERRTIDGFVETGSRVTTVVNGRQLVDFSSNDYLGLARHPAVAAAMSECAERYGSGSGASHLVTGHGVEHTRLEEELAAFTRRERALLFSTGYMANLAVMTTLASRGETVLLDRLSHASLIDGGLLSGARFKRFAHADVHAAESALAAHAKSAVVVATDGVFSMDGDIGPLSALARVSRSHDAWLVVDDAHGLGVIGATGRGTVEHFGLDAEAVPVLMGTLGKAFGSFGAFVAGSAELIELLMQKARSYIYTTALPQPVAAASRKALEIAQRETWRRERVLALAARFRRGAEQMGVPLMGIHGNAAAAISSRANTAASASVGDALAGCTSVGGALAGGALGGGPLSATIATRVEVQPLTPIQPVVLGSSEAALRAQQALFAAGFCVVAIRPPTVPQGSARLRVTLSAAHTETQVDELVEMLSRVCAAPDMVS
ncbi:MAG TPA: 8-amino-7-oxononanoate synthase [Steroidobacteraceae bacterium]|nr:8-amino-7-oxononanoate synthase [Steroidobacteraceae bacterium]